MELTLQEKNKLINFFQFLLDEEISKPLGEMDSEAVDNYIKLILHLQGQKFELSSEIIDEKVRNIFHPEEDAVIPETVKTTKKHFNKKKVWLVAACIAVLMALFCVVSFGSERSVKDILEDYLGTFEFISAGERVDVDNESFGKIGSSVTYKSIEALAEKEKINILYPESIKDAVELISVDKTENETTIDISHTESDIFVSITVDSQISKETFAVCNDKITLNNIDYYLCIMEDVNQAQAYFVYDNNMYVISHTNKNELIDLLNNMEIIEYED